MTQLGNIKPTANHLAAGHQELVCPQCRMTSDAVIPVQIHLHHN